MEKAPLDGIRVIDLSWVWAEPYAVTLLALLGAEVIKVESLKRLDLLRQRAIVTTGPILASPNHSTPFCDLHLNKLSLTLDLTKVKAINILKNLVTKSDVVIQSMRPGVIERLGLSYESLREIKSDIIMLSVSAYGATGPEGTYVGYAPCFSAMSGLAYASGYPHGPYSNFSATIDTRVGTTSLIALLAALNYRQRTGRGQYIDLSGTEAISCMVGEMLMDYTMNQKVTERMGNRDQSMAPHNYYPCHGDDRWVTIVVATEKEWQALCQAMGNPSWTKDNKFRDAYSRWQNQEELDRLVSEWTRQHTEYEVTETLQKMGVAASPGLKREMVSKDPHSKERGIFFEVEHPIVGKRLVMGPPWRFSRTPAKAPQAGPLLGEHNQYVLGELLGMSQDEIDKLVEAQVVH